MGRKPIRLAFAFIFLSTLSSCRAFDGSRCSSTDVVDTVKSLSGENSDNPLAAVLLKLANTTFSLDAIRTVSSSSNETICEGRLTIRSQVPAPTPTGGVAAPETAADQAVREQLQQQLTTRVTEVTYKLEKTDDGRTYVTIIPSDADVLNQQNAQQEERERQYEVRQIEQDDQRYNQEEQEREGRGQ